MVEREYIVRLSIISGCLMIDPHSVLLLLINVVPMSVYCLVI